MKKKIFDIEKMSKETGISIFDIKKALNIPLDGECKATTAKEAKEIYGKMLFSTPEETKAVFFNRWRKLFLLEVEKVTSDKEMRELCEYMPPELEERSIILDKWNKFSLISIKKVNTCEGAREVYDNLPSPCPFVETETIVLKRWIELFLLEVEMANTANEVKVVYKKHLPPNSFESRKAAWKKWIEVSVTHEETKDVESSISDFYHDPEDCYRPDDYINNLLLEKKTKVSTTIGELEDFHYWIFFGGNVTPLTQKIFCFRWIDLSTTAKEVLKLRGLGLLDQESERFAIQKIASFYNWKE